MTAASIIVATYGDLAVWDPLAQQAVESANAQQADADVDVVRIQGPTLWEARNAGASSALGDWLIFLDADDRLGPGYARAMLDAANAAGGHRWLCQPATQGFHEDGGRDEHPNVIDADNLFTRNIFVIGTMISKRLFFEIGGFGPEPVLEDWDLMLRAMRAGGRRLVVAAAVYWVGVRAGSRNRPDLQSHWAKEIRGRYQGVPASTFSLKDPR